MVQQLSNILNMQAERTNAVRQTAESRTLIGIVETLGDGVAAVREYNTQAQGWLVNNCIPLFSQHPLVPGDLVVVWRCQNGVNLCAGLLDGLRSDGTHRNGFLALVTSLINRRRTARPDALFAVRFRPLLAFDDASRLANPVAFIPRGSNYGVGDLFMCWRDPGPVIPDSRFPQGTSTFYVAGERLADEDDFSSNYVENGQTVALPNLYEFAYEGNAAPLASLRVFTPGALTPTYTPDVTNYSINAPAGTTAFIIEATPPSGASLDVFSDISFDTQDIANDGKQYTLTGLTDGLQSPFYIYSTLQGQARSFYTLEIMVGG